MFHRHQVREMEQSKGKQQHMCKNYKFSNHQVYSQHFERNNYNPPSSQGYFKSQRIQKHNLKWRKETYVGNHRSGNPYRKNDTSNRKLGKSSEDVEEEERKKKLNDTAKILLNKIKCWNAEKNVCEESAKSEEDCRQSGENNQEAGEIESWHGEGKVVDGDRKKRIAHSKKSKLIKSRTTKRLMQPVKATARYDVNKAAVKDFQNRIQHKLIEEIMQMPKENLQNVLNDPKINPKMELKMSRLVQENRPLITQKLRALAESKMKSLGFVSNQQLLVDIDKLIDPVIETDLSVLPYELIKQMENIFQVQFDYSQSGVSVGVCDSVEASREEVASVDSHDIGDGLPSGKLKEDLSMYECSTDEDEEMNAMGPSLFDEKDVGSAVGSDLLHSSQRTGPGDGAEMILTETVAASQSSRDFQHEVCNAPGTRTSKVVERKQEIPPLKDSQSARQRSCSLLVTETENASEEPNQIISSSGFKSATCQTEIHFQADTSTQTSEEVGVLYGVPLPKQSKDNTLSTLLEEVSSIQNLTNKLNERRLIIFLELSRMNPERDFISDERTRASFAETLSNGSLDIMDALEKFFKVRPQGKIENSNGSKWRTSTKWVNKNKSKNRDLR